MPKDATTKEIKPVESDENVKEKKFIKTVEKECKLREYAWERLKVLEFWSKILEVYYSVFTALLSVVGVVNGGQFITVPSACFTVAVAILVCFANAQNYSRRAHDLEANISDLLIFKSKLLSLADGESYEKNVEEFYKKCGDSERPGLFDRYKYKCFNNEEHRGLGIVMYFVIFIIYSILIGILFGVPVIFVRMNWDDFLILFRNAKILG